MTGVLDFGIGNIASILNMIECVHGKGMAVHTAEELALCKRLILPGVGAFDAGMSLLNLSGMRNALDKAVANGIPLLGICLGMQMLGLSSEEGDAQGLGYIPFRLQKFRLQDHSLKIPHMGWNSLEVKGPDPIFKYFESGEYVYYVHSFYAANCAESTLAASRYGSIDVTGLVRRGNVWGCQFHPEKSGDAGLRLLRAFAEI